MHRARHLAAVKGAATRRQHAKAKKRGLALGDSVACCAAEALAMSLRLSGWPVSDEDVLALYWLTADDPDEGASIAEALEAAAEFGLAGRVPRYGLAAASAAGERATASLWLPTERSALSLILGVELPGPHTVLATPDGWHSWGELYDPAAFSGAVIEEAWAVTWPRTGRR